MNRAIVKIIVVLLVCIAPVLHAQAQPKAAKTDTASERLKKSIEELDQMMRDFDEQYSTKPVDGPVVKVGDKLYDGSLVSQLENLRTRTFEQTEAAIRGSLDKFVGA